jgi:hypothetical protein
MALAVLKRSILPCAGLSILLLSACSETGGGAGTTPLGMQPSSMTTLPLGKSPKDMLYVSDDGTNEVDLLAWPKPKSISETLSGFSEPQGMCADTSGDVFISNTGDENVLEYNGTKATNTLMDLGQYPISCAYDSVNGDLAVSNIFSTSNAPGSVGIYKHARGGATLFSSPKLQHMYFLAYDGSGNLFITGGNPSYAPLLAELPAGSRTIKLICPNLLGSSFVGGLAWDGKYIVISTNGGVERIKNCKPVGPPTIITGSGEIGDFTIVGDRLINPDYGNAEVEIYAYPKGGKPIQVIGGFSAPIGAAVSQDLRTK